MRELNLHEMLKRRFATSGPEKEMFYYFVCFSDLSLMCQASEGLLGSPPVDIADLKPLCYSAASKLFGDSSGVGVVKNEPGVSEGRPGHHMLHPATYHHGYHGYDPGSLHHS